MFGSPYLLGHPNFFLPCPRPEQLSYLMAAREAAIDKTTIRDLAKENLELRLKIMNMTKERVEIGNSHSLGLAKEVYENSKKTTQQKAAPKVQTQRKKQLQQRSYSFGALRKNEPQRKYQTPQRHVYMPYTNKKRLSPEKSTQKRYQYIQPQQKRAQIPVQRHTFIDGLHESKINPEGDRGRYESAGSINQIDNRVYLKNYRHGDMENTWQDKLNNVKKLQASRQSQASVEKKRKKFIDLVSKTIGNELPAKAEEFEKKRDVQNSRQKQRIKTYSLRKSPTR